MTTQQFGVRGLVALLLIVLGLSIPAVANATISLDTTTTGYATAPADAPMTGTDETISFTATSGDTVFFAEDYELNGGAPSTPSMTGQTWTFVGYGGSAGGWFPVNLAVWCTTLSSSGGTITYNIPYSSTSTNTAAVIIDAFSGVTSVDAHKDAWGKQDPGNASCSITPGYNSSLVVGYTAYGNEGDYTPAVGSGFTETSEIGFNFDPPSTDYDELLGEYSTGNSSGTAVNVNSSDDGYDEGYDELVISCH